MLHLLLLRPANLRTPSIVLEGASFIAAVRSAAFQRRAKVVGEPTWALLHLLVQRTEFGTCSTYSILFQSFLPLNQQPNQV